MLLNEPYLPTFGLCHMSLNPMNSKPLSRSYEYDVRSNFTFTNIKGDEMKFKILTNYIIKYFKTSLR